jgi:uncharacterized protein (TIGR00730 family)
MEKRLTQKTFEQEVRAKNFRVAIFGSARVKEYDQKYKMVSKVAELIGIHGIDVVTGGGPGLMEAANKGHRKGSKNNDADSLGLLIKLPNEQKSNSYLNVKKEFKEFIDRLENFLELSHAVIVAPGGIGTLLELVYTLQVVQVKKVESIPIILMGPMWLDLVKWMQKWQLKKEYIREEDFDSVYVVERPEEAMEIISAAHNMYNRKQKNLCPDLKKYKIKFKKGF